MSNEKGATEKRQRLGLVHVFEWGTLFVIRVQLIAKRNLVSLVLTIGGLTVLTISATIFLTELLSPTHTVVSAENAPLALRLGLLAGLGWLLIGLGIGTRLVKRAKSPEILIAAIGAAMGSLMGLLAWVFIYGLLTFS